MQLDQIFLINRLIHNVKNELSTLKLAASNLKFVLDDLQLPTEQRNQIDEFLQVIQENIKISIRALNRALSLSRNTTQNMEQVNLGQILLELTQKQNQILFKNPSQSFIIYAQPDLLRWFFETLFSFLQNYGHVEIQSTPADQQLQIALLSKKELNRTTLLSPDLKTENAFDERVIAHLASLLGINIAQKAYSKGKYILILIFNQNSGAESEHA